MRRAIEQSDLELLQMALPGFMLQAKDDSARSAPLFWLAKRTLTMDAAVVVPMIEVLTAHGAKADAREPNASGPERTPLSYAVRVVCDRTAFPASHASVKFADILPGREQYGSTLPVLFYQPAVVETLIFYGADPKLAPLAHVHGDLSNWRADNLKTLGDVFDKIQAQGKNYLLSGSLSETVTPATPEDIASKPTLFVSQYGPRRPKP